MKKGQYILKFNTYRCTHIQHEVITNYYPKPNPNHTKGIKCGSRNPNPNPNLEAAIHPKRRRIAALGLGLGFLC